MTVVNSLLGSLIKDEVGANPENMRSLTRQVFQAFPSLFSLLHYCRGEGRGRPRDEVTKLAYWHTAITGTSKLSKQTAIRIAWVTH